MTKKAPAPRAVPYVGIAVSSLLPMSVVWIATGNAWYPLGVVAVYTVVQYLEANLIFPKVVGEQLKMNTLASIVIVLAGGLLWGVAGYDPAAPLRRHPEDHQLGSAIDAAH